MSENKVNEKRTKQPPGKAEEREVKGCTRGLKAMISKRAGYKAARRSSRAAIRFLLEELDDGVADDQARDHEED